jgi:hypothetical protein
MHRSGFVLAAFDTLCKITDRFMKNMRGRWDDNFTREQMSEFFSNICTGYLYSYGEDFANRKKFEKYNAGRYRIFRKCRETGLFDDAAFIADSGGFQISMGRLTLRESEIMMKLYYDFLREYHSILDRAFILDVPPGPGCKIFNCFSDIRRYNLQTYLEARDFPDELRNKIIYIHHFRTPKLWEIYTEILREYEMFPHFQYFGTGGVVANLQGDMVIPCIIYILPLIPLLNECKKYGRTELNFHVLGGANYRDIFFYQLFRRVIYDAHGITVNFTYDSTAPFKQVMFARYLHVENDIGSIIKMEFKSHLINSRFYGNVRVKDQIQMAVDHLSEEIGIKKINVEDIYDENTETLHEDVKVYTMLYILNKFSNVEEMINEFLDSVYPHYVEGNYDAFYEEVGPMMIKLNQGKMSKKERTKTASLITSLEMLKNLDEEKCEYIVNKFLSKDEFTELNKCQRILTV